MQMNYMYDVGAVGNTCSLASLNYDLSYHLLAVLKKGRFFSSSKTPFCQLWWIPPPPHPLNPHTLTTHTITHRPHTGDSLPQGKLLH